MIVVISLHGMKSSRTDLRDLIDEQFDYLSYRLPISDFVAWMGPVVKQSGCMYYDYVLFYVYYVLCISGDLLRTM